MNVKNSAQPGLPHAQSWLVLGCDFVFAQA
jgi:hypothetical protein